MILNDTPIQSRRIIITLQENYRLDHHTQTDYHHHDSYHHHHHNHYDLFTGGAGQEHDPGFLVRGHLDETSWIIADMGFAINYDNYTE